MVYQFFNFYGWLNQVNPIYTVHQTLYIQPKVDTLREILNEYISLVRLVYGQKLAMPYQEIIYNITQFVVARGQQNTIQCPRTPQLVEEKAHNT